MILVLHFISMDHLVRYYLRQAGRGNTDGIGPIYEAPHVLQRGYGIGSFLTGLRRTVRPILWSGAKTLTHRRRYLVGHGQIDQRVS